MVSVSAGKHVSNNDAIFNTVPGETLISIGVEDEEATVGILFVSLL